MNSGSYNEQEAQEILRRAASIHTSSSMSTEELVRAASELGISREAIEQAEEEIRSDRLDKELLGEFRRLQRQKFFGSLGSTLLILAGVWLFVFDGQASDRWIMIGAAYFAVRVIGGVYKRFIEKSGDWQRRYQTWKSAELRRQNPINAKTTEQTIAGILGYTDPHEKLSVVRELRTRSGLELKEAKDAVDDYYRKHPEVTVRTNS